ncbi:MAG: NADP-dependent malic enzyme [Candidatus Thermoplasmatota archaeon]|nr:NADP-dependent malic enzyme [Candidatus Thermoplasmatota archaeon]
MSEEKDKLLKATLPGRQAMEWHPFYRGKVEIINKCRIKDFSDFGVWYTPGVAEPCIAIHADPLASYEHTNRWNYIAVASNGTRVLGLGDIGPLAGYPVMEGKSLLFKYLGGVDATALMIDTKDPDKFIETIKMVAPTFGGINLEDIRTPDCFYILDRLRKELDIPVWHDDQQGTAAISLAGVINGLKVAGKKMQEARMVLVGAGAANLCLAKTLMKAGVPGKNLLLVDSKGILGAHRADLENDKERNPLKWELALATNPECTAGGIAEALMGGDVLVSASKPGPGTIKKEWLAGMTHNPIVFAEANPVPEIWPWEAKEVGVKIFGTGRSDFPNQVNNSIGFPGIFRGTLDVRASTITDEMHIAAAYSIAKTAEEIGIHEDYLVPTMSEIDVFVNEAVAVAEKAMEQGVARLKKTRQELHEMATMLITSSREKTAMLMREGFIPEPPEVE